MADAGNPSKQINHLLRTARVEAGKSLEDAANHLGITAASMSRMETGVSGVMADRVEILARFYGQSVADLFEGKLVAKPNSIDLARMQDVILFVHEKIEEMEVQPSPAKIAATVIQVYERDLERSSGDTDATKAFVSEHHSEFVRTMLMR